MAGGQCHLAIVEERIAGYAAFTHAFFHRPFIERLMVGLPFRRQSVGLALVAHATTLWPGEQIWTSTNQSNRPMRALLARAGFRQSGRIENLDPDDPELVFVHLPQSKPIGAAG